MLLATSLEKDEADKVLFETLNEVQSIYAANSYVFIISILLSGELDRDTTQFRYILKLLVSLKK